MDALRERAQAIIDNPATRNGPRFHVERFLQDQNWNDLAIIVEAIKTGGNYDEILIANDDRTLSDDVLNTVCQRVGNHLEGEHMAGYFFALLNHILAYARTAMDAESAVFEIQKLFFVHNACGRDAAVDHLTATALAQLTEDLTAGDSARLCWRCWH